MKLVSEGMTIQKVEGDKIYASRGYEICISEDNGETWREEGRVPTSIWRRASGHFGLLRRITRGGISFLLPLADGSRLCVISGMILRAEAGSSMYRCVFRFSRGSRPLNLCQTPDGRIYWGEYFLNLRRKEPIHIFCSQDGGNKWDVVYAFDKGAICHVHRIVYDPYDNAVLVCTGDRDHEVAILKTNDGFQTLTSLVKGEKRFRTTSLLPLKQCILYGTDNPDGDNYIMALDRKTKTVERIQKLPGPVLYSCRVGQYAVFTTMVEKGNHEVTLWAGNESAFCLVALLRTRKVNQLWREIAGYSALILPEGIGNWPHLFCTPIGTQKFSDSLIRIDMDKAAQVENINHLSTC